MDQTVTPQNSRFFKILYLEKVYLKFVYKRITLSAQRITECPQLYISQMS